MTHTLLRSLLAAAALLLANGPGLDAQEPKDAKPAPATEAKTAPKDSKTPPQGTVTAPGAKPKAPSKKNPPPVPPNYMLGETPAPANPSGKPARPRLVTKKKSGKIPHDQRLNLNAATKEELKKLPGVTDEYAARIIAGRPYVSKTALVLNHVIPTTVYFLIKDKVAAGAPPAKP